MQLADIYNHMNNDNRLNVDKKINVLGIATTNLNDTVVALDYAKDELGSDTIMTEIKYCCIHNYWRAR
jgi:hypothetical protein